MKLKARRIAIVGAVLIALVMALWLLPSSEIIQFKRTARALQAIPPDVLDASIHSYVREQSLSGHVVPQTVLLSELVARGLIASNLVEALNTKEVLVTVETNHSSYPEDVLVRVHTKSGDIIERGDGSVSKVLHESGARSSTGI